MNMTGDAPYPSLSDYEKRKIAEVVGYYKLFKEENSLENIQQIADLDPYIAMSESYTRAVVTRVKNIPALKKYCMEDRMKLVSNWMPTFMNLRSVFYFDTELEMGFLENFDRENTACRASVRFWDKLLPKEVIDEWLVKIISNKTAMMGDRIVRDLLITTGLFLECDTISCPEVMRKDFLEYYYLMRRYVQTKLKNKDKFEKQMTLFHECYEGLLEIKKNSKQFYNLLAPHYEMELMTDLNSHVDQKDSQVPFFAIQK